MARHAHHDRQPATVPVHVIVVSSSRTPETDRTGPAVVRALEEAGHRVLEREIVPDDVERIRERVGAIRRDGHARAVILAGGTGVSARDGTVEAIEPLLDRRIPGFGELFRWLSFQEIGAASMLSRALAGLAGDLLLFATPGSPAGARLAVERLIAPELGHLVRELRKEAPAADRQLEMGWEGILESLGGRLLRGQRLELPAGLARIAAARQVLDGAGGAAVAELRGVRWLVLGFPDLFRPQSRVLLLREAGPYGEVVALHRWPRAAGIVPPGGGLVLDHHGPVDAIARQVTGEPYGAPAALLAVDGRAVVVVDEEEVVRFDGRDRSPLGTVPQALAHLLLRWSRR